MKLTSILPAVLAASLAAAPAAFAADTSPQAPQAAPQDVECVLVGLVLSSAKEENVQRNGEMMAIYYLGRYEKSGQGGDLATAIRQVAVRVQTNMKTIGPACGDAFNLRMKSLTAVGEELSKPAAPAR